MDGLMPDLYIEPPRLTEFTSIQTGETSDLDSYAVLYSTAEDGVVRLNPGSEAILAATLLSDRADVTTYAGANAIHVPAQAAGGSSLWDLRKSYQATLRPVTTVNLSISHQYLNHLRSPGKYPGKELLMEIPGYLFNDDIFKHLCYSLASAFRAPGEINKLFVDQVFLAAVTHLVSTYGAYNVLELSSRRLSPRLENRAKEFLMSNMQSGVSLSEAAAICGLSIQHFSRSFKGSTGTSPYRWMLEQRVSQAKQMLLVVETPIGDIALACGFADQSHFTRTFSRIVGVSPGAWRRSQAN